LLQGQNKAATRPRPPPAKKRSSRLGQLKHGTVNCEPVDGHVAITDRNILSCPYESGDKQGCVYAGTTTILGRYIDASSLVFQAQLALGVDNIDPEEFRRPGDLNDVFIRLASMGITPSDPGAYFMYNGKNHVEAAEIGKTYLSVVVSLSINLTCCYC
jgi:hypothetical protein